jgi:hypothetical protein
MMRLEIESGSGPRGVDLTDYLEPDHEEQAREDEYAWIKAVRRMRVGGGTVRSAFTFRGDSLWWFAELFLHKEQAILHAFRCTRALETLIERDRPLALRYVSGPHPGVIAAAAAARRVRYDGPSWPQPAWHLARTDARATALAVAARLSRWHGGRAAAAHARLAAFVHRAFWKERGTDGSAESYIGPTLRALEELTAAGDIRYVGIGPRTNFRARRWWTVLGRDAESGIVPIERYAPAPAMSASNALFAARHEIRTQLCASADLRGHAVIRGVDCWPLVQAQLAGVALLQFTWSARAMDEAAAALDAVTPEIAITYAEAGGWGRALALECRRRGIPLAGLQHGFIYRHWLNYRHEPDEMIADPTATADRGFPLPAKTLVFDAGAAAHLTNAGRFPAEAIAITGSPRLDELVAAVRALTPDDLARIRRQTGAAADQPIVLFAAKEREARRALPALIDAIKAMPEVHLAIKPHPAETPDAYAKAVAGVSNVRVLGADAPLAPLLAAAGALVTVNSTVAVDAMALGLPSLVIGLPNNLSPFVEQGWMAGARSAEEIRQALANLLYNKEFLSKLERRTKVRGDAARTSAAAILSLRR